MPKAKSNNPTFRVTFINRFFWPDESATSQILDDLCRDLVRRGYDVTVVTSRQLYGDAKAGLPKHEQSDGIRIRRVGSTTFGRSNLVGRFFDYLTFYILLVFTLIGEARRTDCLVAKTDPPLLSVPTVLIGRLFRTPVVSWCQDLFPEVAWARTPESNRSLLYRILAWLRDASFDHCHTLVVLGRDMREHLQKRLSARPRIVEIPNWSDGRLVHPVEHEANPLRDEWGLTGRFVIGYSGNLGRVHEYKTFLNATRSVQTPEARYLFVGSGALRKRLESEIPAAQADAFLFKPYQPRDQLHLSLSVPDMHWFSLDPAFTALVFPSKFYGILAAGRPCLFIGDPACGLADLIRDHDIGRVFAPGDDAGVARTIDQLASNPDRLTEMGHNARALFDRSLNFEASADQWADALDRIRFST